MVANKLITDAGILDLCEPPPSTDTYKSISHRYLYDTAQSMGEDLGFKLIQNNIKTTKNGQRAFITLFFDTGKGDHPFMMGVRSCYDKSRSVAFVSGAGVYICSNLCVHGEMMLFRKHTPNAIRDLDILVDKMKQQALVRYLSAIKWIKDIKTVNITDRQGSMIVGSALGSNIIPHRSYLKAMEHWKKPPFKEFEGDKTLWGVYNALTYGAHLDSVANGIRTATNITKFISDIKDRNLALV
tara:strand:- start:1224 stop:1946 length:723 start_codon:yes stop_codon:yes gene_type:complete